MCEQPELIFSRITPADSLPVWTNRHEVVHFIYENMKPWHDTIEDIERALDYMFLGPGGFLMLVQQKETLAGLLLMLNTGMKGFVPENILLMVSVDPRLRGRGIGKMLIETSLAACEGDVKLHVEYDNPARRLYEKIGFISKYAEMRYQRD